MLSIHGPPNPKARQSEYKCKLIYSAMVTGLSLVCGDGLTGTVCIYVQVTKLIPLETSSWITWGQIKEDEDIVSILFAVNQSSPYLRAWF